MIIAWRIVREKHAATALLGEGASKYGGRWNAIGTQLVYASGSQALAALELLVHMNSVQPYRYRAFRIQFDESFVEAMSIGALPDNWWEEPPPRSIQQLGSRWAAEGRSAVLSVPSAIIQVEANYLLNPLHPDFQKIKVGLPVEFAFDKRLLE